MSKHLICVFGSINVCVYIVFMIRTVSVPADLLRVVRVTSIIATGNKIVHIMVQLCLSCAALVNVVFC